MSANIHVIGSINIDFVIRTKTLPRPGETLGEGTFFTSPGGKGANQALAAQRLGAAVTMSGCVGEDAYAGLALQLLEEAGVDLKGLQRIGEAQTGAAFINLDDAGENQIAVAPGANALLNADPIDVSNAEVIIAQLEVPEAVIWDVVKDNSHFFCLNAAPAIAIDEALLKRANLLVLNETERAYYADQLTGFEGMIAETYGSRGAALFRGGERVAEALGHKVKTVDTTGAGDCFTGALCTALGEGQSDQDALQFACAAGALAVTKEGAQPALPTRAEVEAFMA